MYIVRHWWGKSEKNLPYDKFRGVITELGGADGEHPSASLKHESEWTLEYGKSQIVTFENVEARVPNPRHMKGVTPEQVVELWTKLADGELAFLESQPWEAGYGS